MGKKNLGERVHYVPLLASVALSASSDTDAINMGLFNQVEFIMNLGLLATADFTLTAEECTASDGTGAQAVAAEYRVSDTVGTDAMGAVTALSASGLTVTDGTYDGFTIIVTVDSDALTDGYEYCRITMTDPGSSDALISIVAACHPRYQTATPSGAFS